MKRPSPRRLLVPALFFLAVLAVGLGGLAAPAFADRVVLTDGTVIEGEIQTSGEFLDVRVGDRKFRRVRRADVAKVESTLSPAQVAQQGEAERLLVEAAAAKEGSDARATAVSRLERIAPALTEPLLLRKLGQTSGASEQRRIAAELLGSHKGDASVRALARTVVLDGVAAVRSAALASLWRIGNPDTGLLFVDALERRDPVERTRATAALATFPRKEAVAGLLKLGPPGGNGGALPGSGSGNGRSRCYVAVLDERAYISGYELSAGGTGRVVAEVAVPVVDVLRTGVVLEVAARYVTEYEHFVRGSVFSFLTGKRFESDEKVLAWWQDAEKSFELSPAAKKQAEGLASEK